MINRDDIEKISISIDIQKYTYSSSELFSSFYSSTISGFGGDSNGFLILILSINNHSLGIIEGTNYIGIIIFRTGSGVGTIQTGGNVEE